jgi:hypothetical protein
MRPYEYNHALVHACTQKTCTTWVAPMNCGVDTPATGVIRAPVVACCDRLMPGNGLAM